MCSGYKAVCDEGVANSLPHWRAVKQQLTYECALEDKEQLCILRQVAEYKMYVQTLCAKHVNTAGPSVDILAQV